MIKIKHILFVWFLWVLLPIIGVAVLTFLALKH